MSRYPNYYAVLQVSVDAQPQEIKRAWKHLLQKSRKHPDLGGSEDEALLINEAYTVLKDPMRRAAYDRIYLIHVAETQAEIAEEQDKPTQNRRRVKRIPYVNEVYIQKSNGDNAAAAQTQDISLYGLKLRTTQKIKSRETIEVSFAQDPGFVIQGTVQWHRMIPQRFGNPIYEAGLKFSGMHMERFVTFLERSGLSDSVAE